MKTTLNCFFLMLALHAVVTQGALTVTKIAAGGGTVFSYYGDAIVDYSLFTKSDGSLWTMGGANLPTELIGSNVTAVAAGAFHSLFLKNDGSLWAMGDDDYGQLGDGITNQSGVSAEQVMASNVTAIAAGGLHSLFLKSDGSLWAMGYNGVGELGDGTTNSTDLPEKIVSSGVIAIAAGFEHSLFLKNDGSLWGMGYNGYGQLGDGTYNDVHIPKQIVSGGVMAIAAGGGHSLFVKTDGSLWGMGDNYEGELGYGGAFGSYNIYTNLPVQIVPNGVTAVAAGGIPFYAGLIPDTSLFLKSDGSLWGMGADQIGAYNTSSFQPEQIVDGGVKEIAIAGNHLLFTKDDGSLWAMGDNSAGELGDGTYNSIYQPELIIPNFQYSANPTVGSIPLIVQFTSTNVDCEGNPITQWNWNFGDGSTSTAQNPSHIYTSANIFSPTLVGTNNIGLAVHGVGPSITASLPTVQYTSNPINGLVPLTVQFTSTNVDSGGNPITQWNWNFGDGSTSTAQNPSHIYTSANTFSPSLIATNNIGITVVGSGPIITVSLPTVQYNANPTHGIVPLTVKFTSPNNDSGHNHITHWNWDFGDGSTSTAQNPSHIYTIEGIFSPNLIATNNIGVTVLGSGSSINVEFNSGLILNGSFETGDFTSWTLAGDSSDTFVDDGSQSGVTPYAGNYEAAFGTVGSLDYLSQTLSTASGANYLLSFWVNSPDGLTPNEFSVSWNGNKLLDETNLPAFGWTNIQFVATATSGSTVLQFGFQDDQSYLDLDDISVVPVAQPGIAKISLSGTNLVLNGTNGISGTTNYLLMGTNLMQPMNRWTRIATNILSASGNFTITATNVVNPAVPGRFYILELQ